MNCWTALNPNEPFSRHDPDHVCEVLPARPRPLGDVDEPQPPRLVHGGLHRGPARSRKRRDLIVGQIAYAVVLHFAGDNCEDGALAFRE